MDRLLVALIKASGGLVHGKSVYDSLLEKAHGVNIHVYTDNQPLVEAANQKLSGLLTCHYVPKFSRHKAGQSISDSAPDLVVIDSTLSIDKAYAFDLHFKEVYTVVLF